MYRLSHHARKRVQYGDSELRRTTTKAHQVRQLFSKPELVVRHCEYHVVYAPYDMECLGAIIKNNVIVTIISDHQIPWLLPKLLAMRRHGLYALRKEVPTIAGSPSRDRSTIIEVITASECKQKTIFAATLFDFSEQWFKSVWFLRILAEVIADARNEPHTSISIIYRSRGKKEYVPVEMIIELLDGL